MPRKSCLPEEEVRDCLVDFLQSLERRPLLCLLQLLFPQGIPPGLSSYTSMQIETEHPTIGKSRADIVVIQQKTVLVLEVKVDACEQLGQYIKYQDFFRHKGYTVHQAGLIDHFPLPGSPKDNEPFFQWLGFPRVLWSELLLAFRNKFANTREFRQFEFVLMRAAPQIGKYQRPPTASLLPLAKRMESLSSDNRVLVLFFRELAARFQGWDTIPMQYGNAPYSLHLGKPSWAKLFKEASCRRIVLGFNNRRKNQPHPEPHFGPCIMLWDASWFFHRDQFISKRLAIAGHFASLAFDIIRNVPGTWHKRAVWEHPYSDIAGLHYANAESQSPFRITETDYNAIGWEETLLRLEAEIRRLARTIDALEPKLLRGPAMRVTRIRFRF